MPKPVDQEKGNLYAAEKADFQPAETGKGANITNKVTRSKGTPMPVGNDSHAKKLRSTWSKANGAKGRFGNF